MEKKVHPLDLKDTGSYSCSLFLKSPFPISWSSFPKSALLSRQVFSLFSFMLGLTHAVEKAPTPMTHLPSHLLPVTQTFSKFFILHPPPVRQTISVLEKKELHNRLCPSVSWSVSSQFSFFFVSILHLLVSPFNLHAPLLTFRSSCLLSCPQALWLLSCPLSSLHTHPSLLAAFTETHSHGLSVP